MLLACGVWGTRSLQSMCSLGCPPWLVLLLLCLLVLHLLLWDRLFGRSLLAPPAAPVGFEPLSATSLRAMSLPACFLVVLAEAACLRKFLSLSSVFPGGPSNLCLRLLFAPCGCRGIFLVVLTAARSLREFWALSGVLPFPGSGPCLACVPLLEALLESLTYSIPRSFLVGSLSAFAEGLADALLLCSEHAFCLFFASVSFVDPFRIVAPLDIRPLRVVALAAGASPYALGSFGAHGARGGSTYIALHRTWLVSTVLSSATWGSGRCFLLLPASIHGDCLFSFTDLYVSQPKMSRRVVLFGHM